MQILHSLTVSTPFNPQRVDVFLSSKLRKFSRNKIQNLIYKKAILVNHKPVDADYRVQLNDLIEVYSPYKEFNENINPENIPLDIIHEDESIIIINKPAGMPVHKGLGNYKGTLLNALAFYFINTNQKINIEDSSIHRLDSGTSGLIIFAKNKIVKRKLEEQIKSNLMHRVYKALVWGTVKLDKGIIDVPLGRNKDNPMIIQAFPLRDDGKEALTHYKVLERFKYASLVECDLQTGRTHQIRIHLQYLGHPILGDQRYPGNFTFKEVEEILIEENVQHQLLHAGSLQFDHPATGVKCTFEAPLNPAFEAILKKLI